MNNFKKNMYKSSEDSTIPPESIIVTNLSSNVDQCGAGEDTKIVTTTITLSAPVTVVTTFLIDNFYSEAGTCPAVTSIITQIVLNIGESTGESLGCFAGAPSFPATPTAILCSTSIANCDNTVDNIVF